MSIVTTVGRDPARIDVDVAPGEPVGFTVPVVDAAGAAQPLAGWTIAAIIVGRYTFTTTVVGTGVQVAAPAADTATWDEWLVPSARWSLWLTPPASEPYLFAAGWVRVTTH